MNKGFKRINQKKISEQVYDQIRDMIQIGELSPGEQLMPERELAELLGVGRSSVREALLKLECLGLVDQRHGEGTFVRSSAENDLNPAFETFLKNHESIYDLMEVRFVLEAWAASTAAERANREQIAKMRRCLEEMAKVKLKGKIGYELNLEFHRLISVATHNTILIHVTNALSGWFQQVTAEVYVKMYEDPEIQDILFLQHQAIVNAIEKRNREEAYQAMTTHLSFAASIFPNQTDDLK
ncbi:MAG: FadR/GntR family transcriptional regulator [Desulfomonilaceae bacterium]